MKVNVKVKDEARNLHQHILLLGDTSTNDSFSFVGDNNFLDGNDRLRLRDADTISTTDELEERR